MEGRDGAAPQRSRARRDRSDGRRKPSRGSRREKPGGDGGRAAGGGTRGDEGRRRSGGDAGGGSGGGEGVTVNEFLDRQRSMQDRASSSRAEASRQRRLEESFGHEGDPGAGAIVRHDPDRGGGGGGGARVVDAVPADHPSSGIVQSHRTCTLCHRSLPRSQFSERDRYGVSLSIAPGAVCRTCAMTVCAVRLKSMPATEHLLLEYAQRGERMIASGGMNHALLTGPAPRNAGLLEGDPDASNESALVLRRGSDDMEGRELTVFNGEAAAGGNRRGLRERGADVMGMPRDVNDAFDGRHYGTGDGDRPADVADCRYIDALLRMPCYLNLNAFGLFTSSDQASVSMAALEAVRLYGTLGGRYFIPHDCDGNAAPTKKRTKKRGQRAEYETQPEYDPGTNPRGVVCLVLGEGSQPRTAVLASQHYGWTALAVDPDLSEEWDGYHEDIPGFTGISASISDFMDSADETMVEFRQAEVTHLVIVGVQAQSGDGLRLRGKGHISEIRARYDDVPTTLVSVSPVRAAKLVPVGRRAGQCGSKLERDIGYEPNCSYVDEGVFSRCRQVEVWNFHNADDEEGGESDGGGGEYDEGHQDDSYQGRKQAEEEEARGDRRRSRRTSRSPGRRRRGSRRKGRGDDGDEGPLKDVRLKSQGEKDAERRRFLEDRVAEFNRGEYDQVEEDDAIVATADVGNNDIVTYDEEEDEEGSLSTLSTKGTLERLGSSGNYGQLRVVSGIDEEGRIIQDQDHHPQQSEGGGSLDRRERTAAELEEQVVQLSIRLSEMEENSPLYTETADRLNEVQEELRRVRELESDTEGEDDGRRGQDWADAVANDDDGGAVCAATALPDEGEMDQVWEKAMARHGEQKELVDQFDEYYGNGEQKGDEDENDAAAEGPGGGEMPPNWEAIFDPSSGEYYYSNFVTGEFP